MEHPRSPNLPSTTTPTKKRQILSTTPSNQRFIHSDTTEAKSTQDDLLSSPRAAVSSTSTNTNTNTKTSADHLIHQSKENEQHRLLQTTPHIQQPAMTHSVTTPSTPSSLSKTFLLTRKLTSKGYISRKTIIYCFLPIIRCAAGMNYCKLCKLC